MVSKWILTYDALHLWRQPLIYFVVLCERTLSLSQNMNSVAEYACKTNCKVHGEKGLWPKWRHHPIFRLEGLGKIIIKLRIAFPTQLRPGHLQSARHKHYPLLSFERLMTVGFTRKLLHAGMSLLTHDRYMVFS
jgi:hypothetical protein